MFCTHLNGKNSGLASSLWFSGASCRNVSPVESKVLTQSLHYLYFCSMRKGGEEGQKREVEVCGG